jgi:protein O-mannosyl-transferase
MLISANPIIGNSGAIQRRFLIALHIFLPATVLALYWPALGYDFVWDDVEYVINNPHIRILEPASLGWMLSGFFSMNWHPLTWFSLAIDYAAVGTAAPHYHLVNLIMHSANSLWVFWLAWVLLRLVKVRHSAVVAMLTALVFAVHPQHVESVAWVSARKDLLCLFFLLPTMIAYLFYARTQHERSFARFYWYGLALLCFALALSAKPLAVTLPAVLLLLDFYPLRRIRWWDKLPFFILSLGVIALTLNAQQGAMPADLSWDQRVFNASAGILFYLNKFLFPYPLSPFYPLESKSSPGLFIPVMAVVGVSVLALYGVYRRQYWGLALWLFYLITLSPMLGIIQVGAQAAADRYTYWPTLAPTLLMAVIIMRLGRGRIFLALLIFVCLMLLTRSYLPVWRDEISLWHHAATYAPQSHKTHANLAAAYLKAQEYTQAAARYRILTLMFPEDADIHYYLADVYIRARRWDEAAQTYHYILAQEMKLERRRHIVYSGLAQAAWGQQQHAQARLWLAAALAFYPDYSLARQLDALYNAE